jgi:lycopene cyclase domain-containing protein
MFGQNTYLVWLLLFIGLPILILAAIWRRQLWVQRRALAWITLGALVGGWAWDALSVRWEVWRYDPNNITGVWVLGLPLEELLWIVGVTVMFGGLTVVLAERHKAQ